MVALFLPFTLSAKQFTVVLDPGHGGKDPGAVGRTGQEKTINLNVALKAGKMIEEKYPDVKVVYTRKSDKYVTLQERPTIANNANGDLFISIHTNSADSKAAYGAETFTLGLSKSEANFEVAKRENSVLLLEEGNKEIYQGFDPTSPDSYIMFEFMQSKYIDQSVEIAYYTQQAFTGIKRYDRGVKQNIFWVLHQVKMPSILIELGFISNPNEEKFLTSNEGQQKMACCIFNAFEKYKHEYDKRTINKPVIERQGDKDYVVSSEEDTDKGIRYCIQVFSSRTEIQDNHHDMQKAKKFKPVTHKFTNGWHKYYCTSTSDYKTAQKNLKEIKKLFKDAFIVAFKDDKTISVKEALEIQNK